MKRLPDYIIKLICSNKYYTKKHFIDRQIERGLEKVDVKEALIDSEVIEYVYKHGIGEKFVVYCKYNNFIFHIAMVYKNNVLVLRTIYIPDARYKIDKKTRVKGNL